MFKHTLISLLVVFSVSLAHAKKGNPVPHKHGNRTHSHPLPNTGINHSHNKNNNKKNTTKEWANITTAEGTNTRYDFKTDSFKIKTTTGGKRVATAIFQISNPKTRSISLIQYYVSFADCKRGMGKLVALDMGGDFKYDNDFVKKGSSVASLIAENLCFAARNDINKGF